MFKLNAVLGKKRETFWHFTAEDATRQGETLARFGWQVWIS